MTPQAYPFRKLTYKASWVASRYDDRGVEYIEQQTFDILTRLPKLYRDPSFDMLVKITKSTSLHVHLTRQGWTLASIDEASLKIVTVN
jgi:hypothetical protein